MVKLNYTERIGFAKELLKFIESHRAELTAAGLNPTTLATTLKNRIDANIDANDEQEQIKADLHRSTDKVVAADRDMYVTASSFMDVLSGALMKNSRTSKVLRRLRSKVKLEPCPPKATTQ